METNTDSTKTSNGVNYTVVSNLDDLNSTTFYQDLEQAISQGIGLDTESSGLDYFVDTLLLVQLEVNDNVYVLDAVGFGIGPI